MKTLKAIIVLCCMAAIGVGITGYLNADTWNKKTIITITEPLQIPGAVLTPGKYVFKLADSSSNRHIVQVFNEDESHIINTILAIPNERLRPTGKSEFGFWEVPAGSTPALRSWFYPGNNMGQEFAYPKQEASKLTTIVKEEVPSIPEEEYSKATQVPQESVATAPEPEPEPPVVQSVPPPEPAPRAETPEPRRTVEVTTPSDRLPATASSVPLIGLLGLLFTGLGSFVRKLRRR